MKALLVFVVFFLVFILIASRFIGNVDLTPTTGETAQVIVPDATQPAVPMEVVPAATQPIPMMVQVNPTAIIPTAVSVPVTGGCTNPYIVQPGDWLLNIANKCATSLAAILQVNPQITNPDLIYPEQLVSLPGPDFVPVTGGCSNPYNTLPGDWLQKIAVKCGTTLASILQANPQLSDPNLIYPNQPINITNTVISPTNAIPITGLVPTVPSEIEVQVQANNLKPNTPVNIAIGRESEGYTVVANAVTNAAGSLTTHITIPNDANSHIPWVVVITTISNQPITVFSQSFSLQ